MVSQSHTEIEIDLPGSAEDICSWHFWRLLMKFWQKVSRIIFCKLLRTTHCISYDCWLNLDKKCLIILFFILMFFFFKFVSGMSFYFIRSDSPRSSIFSCFILVKTLTSTILTFSSSAKFSLRMLSIEKFENKDLSMVEHVGLV